MKWIIYNFLFLFFIILFSPKFISRIAKRGGYYKNFSNRFSIYKNINFNNNSFKNKIWIHGVSVGEINIALELIKKIRKKNNSVFFIISTNTSTAYKIVEKEKHNDDILIYFPFDIPVFINKSLKIINPQQILLIEGEFWPNLVLKAKKLNIPVHLINARISNSSYKNYLLFKYFTKDIISKISTISVQSENDCKKFIKLGANKNSICVAGSMKFDLVKSSKSLPISSFFNTKFDLDKQNKIFLMGVSTWPNEEKLILDTYQSLKKTFSELILIIAPRHIERVPEIEKLIKSFQYNIIKRSDYLNFKIYDNEVLLIDSTGELNSIFNEIDISYIGKSFSIPNIGGQNLIEPASKNTVIITGKYMDNFRDIISIFDKFNARIVIKNSKDLELKIKDLLANKSYLNDMKIKSGEAIAYGKGALDKTLTYIKLN